MRTTDTLGPDLWLNAEMLARGGARMRVYPDTAGGSEAFPAMEAGAREAWLGLWKLKAYRVAEADRLPEAFDYFRLVHGRVAGMTGTDEYGAACDLSLAGSALVLEIAVAAAAYCQLPEGTEILARGYVREGRMEVTHPLNLQAGPSPARPDPA